MEVRKQTLSDTMQWLLKEVESFKRRAEREGGSTVLSKKELLKVTYSKTGKTLNTDGTPVWIGVVITTHSLFSSFCTGQLVKGNEWPGGVGVAGSGQG